MFHGKGQLFHRGIKQITEVLEYCVEVSYISWRCLNAPRRCQIFHGGVKYSTEV